MEGGGKGPWTPCRRTTENHWRTSETEVLPQSSPLGVTLWSERLGPCTSAFKTLDQIWLSHPECLSCWGLLSWLLLPFPLLETTGLSIFTQLVQILQPVL